jgi:hypothetical protein
MLPPALVPERRATTATISSISPCMNRIMCMDSAMMWCSSVYSDSERAVFAEQFPERRGTAVPRLTWDMPTMTILERRRGDAGGIGRPGRPSSLFFLFSIFFLFLSFSFFSFCFLFSFLFLFIFFSFVNIKILEKN